MGDRKREQDKGNKTLEYLSYLSFPPRRWWHCFLLIPEMQRKERHMLKSNAARIRQDRAHQVRVMLCVGLSDRNKNNKTQNIHLTLTPSGALCTTVL